MRENRAAEDWAKIFGPLEDLPKHYPYRNHNEAAIQLKLLAVPLGIDFALPGESWRYSPLYAGVKRALWEYPSIRTDSFGEIRDYLMNPKAGALSWLDVMIQSITGLLLLHSLMQPRAFFREQDSLAIPEPRLQRLDLYCSSK